MSTRKSGTKEKSQSITIYIWDLLFSCCCLLSPSILLQVGMSEEAELRECNEAFESEEGDVDPFLEDEEGEDEEETESSRELMERLRELEVSWGQRGRGGGEFCLPYKKEGLLSP